MNGNDHSSVAVDRFLRTQVLPLTVMVASLFCGNSFGQEEKPPGATARLAEIEKGIAKAFDKLHNQPVAIEYRVDFEYDDPERDPLAFLWLEQRFAMDEGKKHYYGRRDAIHRQLDHSDPRQIETSSFNGIQGRQLLEKVDGNGMTGTVYKDLNKFGGIFWLDRYLEKIGYPIRPRDKESAEKNTEDFEWLPNGLKKLKYLVAATQESVDGDWCHVVEAAGQDKLWIDVRHGFLVRKRLFSLPKQVVRSSPWFAWTEVTNTELEKVSDDLWLPRRCVVERFDSTTADEDFRTKRVQKEVLVVSSIAVGGSLPPDQFALEFPMKTFVGDVDSGESFVVAPEDLVRLETAAAAGGSTLKGSFTNRWFWIVVGNGVVFIALATLFARRLQKK